MVDGNPTQEAGKAMRSTPIALARRYFVDDLDAAVTAGSRLHKVLEARAGNQSCIESDVAYLHECELHSLAQLIKNEVSWGLFKQNATVERDRRVALVRAAEADTRRAKEEAQRLRLEAFERKRQLRLEAAAQEAARIAEEWVKREKERTLLAKYGVAEPICAEDRLRLMQVIGKLEADVQLDGADVAWLLAKNDRYRLKGVLAAYHRREADVCIVEFKRTNDAWQAVNASGHLRKCDAAKEADALLATLDPNRMKQPKLHSAVLTTHGGAKRDLGRLAEAQAMGEKAHALQPENFRPCTLLGAVHIQQRNYELGDEWYRKAEARGASSGSIKAEIQALLKGMTGKQREAAIHELCRIDPERYGWLAVT